MPVRGGRAPRRARSSVGCRDRLREVAGERVPPGHVGVGRDELRPGRLRLEQLDCLGEQLLGSWISKPMEHEAEAGEDAACGHGLALVAVEDERLLERLPCLLQPALLLGGRGPALHQRRAHGVAWRDELEGDSEMPLGLVDVE